jgi:glycosyltransferase involved in cell wall biosynthesis
MITYNPLVSIIITCYNYDRFVKQAIDSALNQTYESIEIVIVDDGSTDNSKQVIEEYKNNSKIICINQENTGSSVARNNGIAVSKGEIILLLDADDVIDKNYVEAIVNNLNDYRTIVTTDCYHTDVDLNIIDIWKLKPTSYDQILKENSIVVSSGFSRKLFDEVGGYDPLLTRLGCEDWDLWIRMLRNGATVKHINSSDENFPFFKYRKHGHARNDHSTNNRDTIIEYLNNKYKTPHSAQGSKTNKEIANLFWHGELTKLEKTCIQSFIEHGFHTKIWSYTNIQLDGAESCDARLVLPEEHLTKYKQQHFGKDGSFMNYHASMAAFADAFRWNVINKFDGWWFDADCYCLKSSDEFKKLRENKPFISGLQESHHPSVACGAFYANQNISTKLVDRLNLLCERYDYEFPRWGMIGPELIGDVVQSEDLLPYILSPEKFYSIEGHQTNYYTDPLLKNNGKALIANSYVTHIWHTILVINNVDKNNAPENSLLKEFYDDSYTNDVLPDVEAISRYNISLERYIQISKLYKKILDRPGDSVGVSQYCWSGFLYSEIENIFKESEEYKQLRNN